MKLRVLLTAAQTAALLNAADYARVHGKPSDPAALQKGFDALRRAFEGESDFRRTPSPPVAHSVAHSVAPAEEDAADMPALRARLAAGRKRK